MRTDRISNMKDLVIHLSDEQITNFQAVAAKKGTSVTDEFMQVLDKIQKVLDNHFKMLDGLVLFQYVDGNGDKFDVNVPYEVVAEARAIATTGGNPIMAIRFVREKIGCGLKDAKGVVDILRGMNRNLADL